MNETLLLLRPVSATYSAEMISRLSCQTPSTAALVRQP
jgi:hypothetical protein